MRVVLYNFVQPDAPAAKQGGGVAIYQKNLTAALLKRGINVVNLSSGDRYTVIDPRPRIKVSGRGRHSRAYVLNSPMVAPAHSAFYALDQYQHRGLDSIPAALKKKFGDIDVFHFQNLEGLTASFFRQVREEFPQARLLFSAHNYNLVCPQVNLWFREFEVCENYRDGRACVNCLHSEYDSEFEVRRRRVKVALERLRLGWHGRRSRIVQVSMRALFYAERYVMRDGPLRAEPKSKRKKLVLVDDLKAAPYRQFRNTNIDLCANTFDKVITVSARARQVLIDRGIPADKISVSYIGTAHSQLFAKSEKKQSIGSGLHIVYLGYMRADKGFYFFLESLFSIPDYVAQNLRITIAAPVHDPGVVPRLKGLAHRFREINIYNGYTHATLDEILKTANLGLVPVLWEDNLPQVAIEIVSRGIPILTSDRGGAQEIGENEAFTFKAGSTRSFVEKLEALATGKVALGRFWDNETRIFSMDAHVAELLTYYQKPSIAEEQTETGKCQAPQHDANDLVLADSAS